MKKKLLFLIPAVALLLGACDSISPDGGLSSSQIDNTTTSVEVDDRDPQIVAIYNLYLQNGGTLSYNEWLQTIKGEKGEAGQNGQDGKDGSSVLIGNGAPAAALGKDNDSYINLDNWDYYIKDEGAWSKQGNLKGSQGDAGNDGKSAYDIAVEHGFVGSEEEWLESLKGEQGEKGEDGTPAHRHVTNVTYSGNIMIIHFSDGSTTQINLDTGSSSTDYVAVSSLSIAPSALELVAGGDPAQLTPTVLPDIATNKEIHYSTSVSGIVSVSSEGVVTPLKAGSTVITATSVDNELKTAECTVTVTAPVVHVASVSIPAAHELNCGDTYDIVATIVGENNKTPDNSNVTFEIVSGNVATITPLTGTSCRVTASSNAGTITIKATSEDGNVESNICTITVTDPVTHVTNVECNTVVYKMFVGDNLNLNVIVTPSNATNKSVNWSSSNTNVATVDANGHLVAVGAGNTTITVASVQDPSVTDSFDLTVAIPVTSVTLNAENYGLLIGTEVQLTATVAPANATNKSILWSSSDPSVATVDDNGHVTAIATGNAVITAKSVSNPTVQDTCNFEVATPVSVLAYLDYNADEPYQEITLGYFESGYSPAFDLTIFGLTNPTENPLGGTFVGWSYSPVVFSDDGLINVHSIQVPNTDPIVIFGIWDN